MKKRLAFWLPLAVILLSDCTSKQLAEDLLEPAYVPHQVIGDVVRFTLAWNPGAAFSVYLGEHSRWIFAGLAMVMLGILWGFYRKAAANDVSLSFALALIAGGALGNLLDRLRSPRGVVDFIDIGVGDARFYVFNVADMGVTFGAALLALLLLLRERQSAAHMRGDEKR